MYVRMYVCMYVRSEIVAYVSSECHRGPSNHAGVVPKFDSQVRSSHPSSQRLAKFRRQEKNRSTSIHTYIHLIVYNNTCVNTHTYIHT